MQTNWRINYLIICNKYNWFINTHDHELYSRRYIFENLIFT